MKNLLTQIFVFALSAALLVGCAVPTQNTAAHQHPQEGHSIEIVPELNQLSEVVQSAGGILRLKINPEIALHYDENGKVTKLEGRNADGVQLLQSFTGYEGKETSQVLEELVQVIGQAGYFVEEAEGKARKIVLELDPGSQVPHEKFLEDMAQHVKACVESKSWNGDREYDYAEPIPQEATAPAATEPAEPAATTPATKETETATSTVPAGLCPVCADDDCKDGAKCDDADDKAENLKEYERLMSGKVCPTCADPDCDDGAKCDDADEKAENEKENEAKKKAASTKKKTSTKKTTTTAAKKTTTSTKKTTTAKKSTTSGKVPAGLCPVCADDDCDDGAKCDDADEKAENLKEYKEKQAAKKTSSTKKTTTKKVTKCSVCGESDCDDGKYCDDWDDRDDRDDDDDDDD